MPVVQPLSDSSRGGGLGGWEGQLLDLLERFAKLPAAALGGMQGAGAALAGGVDGLMGWIRESLVMLLEVRGRGRELRYKGGGGGVCI